MSRKPIIGLASDQRLIAPHGYHCVGDKYVRAVVQAAGGIPLLLPADAQHFVPPELLDTLDGLVLPGAYTNIDPGRYRGGPAHPDLPLDPTRDEVDLGLIPAVLEMEVPLFAICRGFQALNVALGGSIHQKVHEVAGLMDHRENKEDPLEVQYAVSHLVMLEPTGMLAGLVEEREQMVNSVHGQGVDRLAEGLIVEARAPDGLIEAVRVAGARGFALGVQWHPEWQPDRHPFYSAMWTAFGAACRERARRRAGAASATDPVPVRRTVNDG